MGAYPIFGGGGSGSGTPAGSTGELQWNDNGAFGAESNLFWDQSNNYLGIGTSIPTSHLEVTGFTLGGASGANNLLRVVGTLAAVNTATARGVAIDVTSAGSSAQNIEALALDLGAGYTGGSITSGLACSNFVAGTGTGSWTISSGNFGVRFSARGITAGHNVGALGNAQSSSSMNMGLLGRAVNSSNSPALNMGGAGKAASGTVNIGWFAGLSDATPSFSASCALVADNMAVAAAIFTARDNGTAVFTIADGGAVTATSSIKSTNATAGIGYDTGAGGTVTQNTSKSTGVTLNKVCGQITLNNATLNAGAEVGFTLTNSAIAATDVVIVHPATGATADAYIVDVDAVAAGSCRIILTNVSGSNLGEAVVLNFAVIKAVAA